MSREAMKLALEALNTTESDCGSRAWEREQEAITALREALAEQPAQQEPVAWQWRRKDQPWSLEYTFNSEVHVTTKDSERRALYTSPPPQPERVRELECVIADLKAECQAIRAKQPTTEDSSAVQPAPVPEGWKLVPYALTPEMSHMVESEMERWGFADFWRKLLNSAPVPAPVQQEPEIVQRVKRYAGQTLRTARNPNITARECIELANWFATPPAQPAPVQDLPFGVGGGLVAIKTLLSRDPCVHANTAIQMIDAILKEHPAAQRTWVGLTDEEINSVRYKHDWTAPWTNTTFARAIEQRLKDKNT